METIGFSCSPGAVYDNMLPANASEKFKTNRSKEGRKLRRYGVKTHKSGILVSVKAGCFAHRKNAEIWVAGDRQRQFITIHVLVSEAFLLLSLEVRGYVLSCAVSF